MKKRHKKIVKEVIFSGLVGLVSGAAMGVADFGNLAKDGKVPIGISIFLGSMITAGCFNEEVLYDRNGKSNYMKLFLQKAPELAGNIISVNIGYRIGYYGAKMITQNFK